MYCPRCGIENLSEACFCRACGADISLVPQALTGHLPSASIEDDESAKGKRRKKKDPPTLDKIFETIFLGLAFMLIVAAGAVFFTRGFFTWIWFIIPSFALLGSGIGQYMRFKQEERKQSLLDPPSATLSSSRVPLTIGSSTGNNVKLPVRDTSEIVSFDPAPPSISEGTTRLLDETEDRSILRREQKRR